MTKKRSTVSKKKNPAPASQPTKDVVPDDLRRQVISRWREINKDRAGIDYKFGVLGRDVRAQHIAGSSGEFQTRSWFVKNLEVGISTARKLVVAGQAVTKFSKQEWEILGGWQTVQFVMHLAPAAHKKILSRAQEFFNRYRRPMSYSQVRSVAFDLGFRSRIRGRPLRSETEEKLNTLRTWVDHIYRKYANLPDMPEAVQAALRGSRVCDPIAAAG